MGLLQKKPVVATTEVPLYTVGNQLTLLIVGLGNPGKKYGATRHNVGFASLEEFVSRHAEFSHWIDKKGFKCSLSMGTFGSTRVIAIKPTTFMNNSGESVQAVMSFYKIPPHSCLVVYDELDLAFGQIRVRTGGDSAGHNGIKSIIEHVGDGFNRVRVGIANQTSPKADSAEFVLKPFNSKEKPLFDPLLDEVDSLLTEYIYRGTLSSDTRNFIV